MISDTTMTLPSVAPGVESHPGRTRGAVVTTGNRYRGRVLSHLGRRALAPVILEPAVMSGETIDVRSHHVVLRGSAPGLERTRVKKRTPVGRDD